MLPDWREVDRHAVDRSNFRYSVPKRYGAYGTYTRSAQSSSGNAANPKGGGIPDDTYREAEVLVGARNVPLPDGRWLELARFQSEKSSDEAVVLALANSPWQARNLASDQSRSDYVDEPIDWGSDWAPVVYAYR